MSDNYLNLNGASRFWSKIKAYVDAKYQDKIASPNGTYTAQMQNDGNFVVYNGSSAKWNIDDTITRWSNEDADPVREHTTSASKTISANTSSWTNVQDFTVPKTGWYLVTLMQYVNTSSNPSSGHAGIQIIDGDNRNHRAYMGFQAVRGGGTMTLTFIGRFVANTTYHISAMNTFNQSWTMNRTLGDEEFIIQYLHRDT